MSIFDNAKAKLHQDLMAVAGEKMEQVISSADTKARYKERIDPYRQDIAVWLDEAARDFKEKAGATTTNVTNHDHGRHYSLNLEVRFPPKAAGEESDIYNFLIRIDGEQVSFYGSVRYPRAFGNTIDFFRNDRLVEITHDDLRSTFEDRLHAFIYAVLEKAQSNGDIKLVDL